MKFTWGHGVTLGFILFVGYILYFVFVSFTQDIDLVAEDYYAQEVAFQDRIEQTENAKPFAGDISVAMKGEALVLTFPTEAQGTDLEGVVYLFRPSDTDLDLKFPLTLDENGQMQLPAQVMTKGRYEVQLLWSAAGTSYYVSKSVVI